MNPESLEARLSDDIVPIDRYVNADYEIRSVRHTEVWSEWRSTLYKWREVGTRERVQVMRGHLGHPVAPKELAVEEEAYL